MFKIYLSDPYVASDQNGIEPISDEPGAPPQFDSTENEFSAEEDTLPRLIDLNSSELSNVLEIALSENADISSDFSDSLAYLHKLTKRDEELSANISGVTQSLKNALSTLRNDPEISLHFEERLTDSLPEELDSLEKNIDDAYRSQYRKMFEEIGTKTSVMSAAFVAQTLFTRANKKEGVNPGNKLDDHIKQGLEKIKNNLSVLTTLKKEIQMTKIYQKERDYLKTSRLFVANESEILRNGRTFSQSCPPMSFGEENTNPQSPKP